MDDLGQEERVERRLRGRLDHDGEVREQRRRQLGHDHELRDVPRRDGTDDSDGLAVHQRPGVGAAARLLPVDGLRRQEEGLEHGRAVRTLGQLAEPAGRPHLGDHDLGHVRDPVLVGAEEARDRGRPVVGRQARPGGVIERSAGRRDSTIHVRFGGARCGADGLARVGRDHRDPLVAGGRQPLAADVETVVLSAHGCHPLSFPMVGVVSSPLGFRT